MSRRQREDLDAMVRSAPLDLGGEVAEQREIFSEMISAIPVAPDVGTSPDTLGGVPVLNVEVAGETDDTTVLFYVHGGAFAIGSAALSVGLASDLARRVGTRAITVEYRLAPEAPFPAAVEDLVAAYAALTGSVAPQKIAFAGESAGAGLLTAALIAARQRGLAVPACSLLMSPWVDLSLSGDSVTNKAEVDPALTADGLRRRIRDYLGGAEATDPLASPLFADLHSLPPMLIQAGSHEILLDDATRLAARAAAADVQVTLQVTPEVPHVFQGFAAMLEEGDRAMDAGARFIRRHLSLM